VLERATVAGFAPEGRILEWIGRKYPSEEEACVPISNHRDHLAQKRALGLELADYDATYDAYDEKSA
jgi:hypothetical protein